MNSISALCQKRISTIFRAQWHVGLSKSHVYHQLALGRMPGNMPLASRILRQHNATWRKSADVTIARLEFDLTGQPEHKQSLWRIVPIRFTHTRWDIANIIPRGWEVIRKTQRRIVLERLSWLQINIDVFHVSFTVAVGKNSKTFHTLIVSPVHLRSLPYMRLLQGCQRDKLIFIFICMARLLPLAAGMSATGLSLIAARQHMSALGH